MPVLKFSIAGELHGSAVVGIIEGIPAGLPLDIDRINEDLAERQKSFKRTEIIGRGRDEVRFISGVRDSQTLGAQVSFLVENAERASDVDLFEIKTAETENGYLRPRPGHADLSGAIKYGFQDLRGIVEVSSARETAGRIAAGSVAKQFLEKFAIGIVGHVVNVAGIQIPDERPPFEELAERAARSVIGCIDPETEKRILEKKEEARAAKDKIGGIFEVVVHGLPVGLGSFARWDQRLDSRLASAILSIPGVKGVEFGTGFALAEKLGSEVQDEICYRDYADDPNLKHRKGFYRTSNNAGGIEGGLSNGEDVVFRAVVKPLSALERPVKTVNIQSKREEWVPTRRGPVCIVSACAVIAKAMTAFVMADAFLEKFGADSLREIDEHYWSYLERGF